MKSGKVINGKLAEIFSNKGIASPINDNDKSGEIFSPEIIIKQKSKRSHKGSNK